LLVVCSLQQLSLNFIRASSVTVSLTLAASLIGIGACDFSDQMERVDWNDLSGMMDGDGGRI